MSSPYLPIMPISKVISRISLHRVPVKELQGIQQIEDRIYSWPHDLEFEGRHLTEPIPGQAAQILGCLHLRHCRDMLLGRLDVAGSTGEGEGLHGLRVQGIALLGEVQIAPGKLTNLVLVSIKDHASCYSCSTLLLSSRSRLHLCCHPAHPLM